MLILPTLYLGPVSSYAALYHSDQVVEDRYEHFVKQTYRNRCVIATANGRQALTVPIVRDSAGHSPIRDLRLSDHGNWRHLHWQAIRTAYDASPYFFYYADDFAPIFEHRYDYLVDLNEALQAVVLSMLSLEEKRPLHSQAYLTATPEDTDFRPLMSPKSSIKASVFEPRPYYQVFRQRTGFLPDLSIIDLLFNHGPESRLFL